jgi:hypothetical protein
MGERHFGTHVVDTLKVGTIRALDGASAIPVSGSLVDANGDPIGGAGLPASTGANKVLFDDGATQDWTGPVALVRQATVTLTDAQVKALPTTPVEIVPGVADKMVQFLFGLWRCDFQAGTYTDAYQSGHVNLCFAVGGAKQSLSYNESIDGAFADNSGVHTIQFAPFHQLSGGGAAPWASWITEVASVAGQPLLLQNHPGGSAVDLTGGDSANTLKVTVFYVVVDL